MSDKYIKFAMQNGSRAKKKELRQLHDMCDDNTTMAYVLQIDADILLKSYRLAFKDTSEIKKLQNDFFYYFRKTRVKGDAIDLAMYQNELEYRKTVK